MEKAGVDGDRIEAVGLTGQMHGLVLLDELGDILRPAILWNDQCVQSQRDEIHRKIGKEKFIQITGNVALTGLKVGTPVAAGGGDQSAQAVGVGAIEAGSLQWYRETVKRNALA